MTKRLLLVVSFLMGGVRAPALDFPGVEPGPAQVSADAARICLSNRVLNLEWQRTGEAWHLVLASNVLSGAALRPSASELFDVSLADGRLMRASEMKVMGPPAVEAADVSPSSTAAAQRRSGRRATLVLNSPDDSLTAEWTVQLRDGANYAQVDVRVRAQRDLDLQGLTLWHVQGSSWRAAGEVDGSPVTSGDLFLAVEDPSSTTQLVETNPLPGRVLGPWSPANVSTSAVSLTWPIRVPPCTDGTWEVEFRYTHGTERLDIEGAALLRNGRVIATDPHAGFAGVPNRQNLYLLAAGPVDTGAVFALRAMVHSDRKNDSYGEVRLRPAGDRIYRAGLPGWGRLAAGEAVRGRAVIGASAPGQMRRSFLCYVERERAHPYRPFIHYNSWYDIAWSPFALNESNCVDAIRQYGERFIRPYGVPLDSLVFDDGWDDPQTLWRPHAGFPRGFAPLAEACRDVGSHLGVWLSPFGGYGGPKGQRLKYGRAQGFELNDAGFSLAGTNYYARFSEVCVEFIRRHGVNYFKFDGMAAGSYASGASARYQRDTAAMQRLMLELRKENPDLFINLTTGSWPSPFWLWSADSIWRQGEDTAYRGAGPKQQQWITYRDGETFQRIVRRGPLFPLNALMIHGVTYARHGNAADPSYTSAGLRDDLRCSAASGTALQELYITPSRLTGPDWAMLAETVRWIRTNADVLVDTHWVGGDPARGDVYGWASWAPRKGLLALRNPGPGPRTVSLDLAAAFELPADAPRRYRVTEPWAGPGAGEAIWTAGAPRSIALPPFELRVLEAEPLAP